jgi:excisionase family DNA binding protein
MQTTNSTVDVFAERTISYQEAEQLLGLRGPTLRWLVHQRRIPHIRLGPRMVRFRVVELNAWLEAHACRPAGAVSAIEEAQE